MCSEDASCCHFGGTKPIKLECRVNCRLDESLVAPALGRMSSKGYDVSKTVPGPNSTGASVTDIGPDYFGQFC